MEFTESLMRGGMSMTEIDDLPFFFYMDMVNRKNERQYWQSVKEFDAM